MGNVPRFTALAGSVAVFGMLYASTGRTFGLVGEVAVSWALPDSPSVLVQVEPPILAAPGAARHAGHRLELGLGALEASQVRPLESVDVGIRLPLAVNQYTGGLPDWPAAVLLSVTGRHRAIWWLSLGYGLGLLALVWWVLAERDRWVAASIAAVWLALDWNFLFYRQVLGGTEVTLVAATVLWVQGMWLGAEGQKQVSHRLLGLAAALGVHAKITFLPVLCVLAFGAWLCRADQGLRSRVAWKWIGAGVALGLAPLAASWIHHGLAIEATPHVVSHDFVGLQISRLTQGWSSLGDVASSPRESLANAWAFALQPLAFFGWSCGAQAPMSPSIGRTLGWGAIVLGSVAGWIRPGNLGLRLCSVTIPLAAATIFLLNRDVHHLAMLTGVIAVWAGLALAQLGEVLSRRRQALTPIFASTLLLPWGIAGVRTARIADQIVGTCSVPVILAQGQREVVDLIRKAEVRRLVTCSYDLYGVIDVQVPEVDLLNGWGAMSHSSDRRATFSALLGLAEGGHILLVRPEAPRIYDSAPSEQQVLRLAEQRGLEAQPVATLRDAQGPWARLYRIQRR